MKKVPSSIHLEEQSALNHHLGLVCECLWVCHDTSEKTPFEHTKSKESSVTKILTHAQQN